MSNQSRILCNGNIWRETTLGSYNYINVIGNGNSPVDVYSYGDIIVLENLKSRRGCSIKYDNATGVIKLNSPGVYSANWSFSVMGNGATSSPDDDNILIYLQSLQGDILGASGAIIDYDSLYATINGNCIFTIEYNTEIAFFNRSDFNIDLITIMNPAEPKYDFTGFFNIIKLV